MGKFTFTPVRQSQINSPVVIASRPAETIALYHATAEMMQRPDAVEFPTDTVGLVLGAFCIGGSIALLTGMSSKMPI